MELIERQAAIDVVDSETVSTNPEHFKSSEKFINFMDDSDISSFGKWQWSNGFNTALTAVGIDLKKLPSAQPDITDEQAIGHLQASGWMQSHDKQMYEMGLKERLADDSDSYDALLPSAQPDLSDYSDKLWRNAYERGKAEAEVQKMQDLEQAEIQKAYELGKLDAMEEMPHWVPCSERLPEEEIDVLVTRKFLGCKDSSHGWNNHIPPSTYVEVAQYSCGEWEALSDEYKIARNRHTNPIAWMPLPEAYREEGT